MNSTCPDCGGELVHKDTFGNIDHCLEAIGHPRGYFDRPRQPVKRGDIYYCDPCEANYYTLEGQSHELHSGYPC